MKRLTYMDRGKWRLRIGDTEYSGKEIDWFAAYENTGLEPETISKIRDIVLNISGDLDRLRDLSQADRDGRCVVLPMSTPSMAYTVDQKGGYISSGFYATPGAVLHDTERGYIIAKTREAAEETLKGEKHG